MNTMKEKNLAYPHLFSEGSIGRLTLQNRVVMAPMGVFMANFDGTPSEQLIDYYEERAKNGVALIFTGICRVNDLTGASGPRQEALSRDMPGRPAVFSATGPSSSPSCITPAARTSRS